MTSIFSFIPTMFSMLSQIYIITWDIFSSANVFDLVKTKIFSFGKELTLSQTSPGFYLSAVQIF